jgi:predicted PurR-regulated permease PerM
MKKRLGIVLLALVLIQFTVANVYGQIWDASRPHVKDLSPEELQEFENSMQSYIRGKTVVSVINSLLMAYIMWFYYVMYRENGSKFSLGLIALSAALLVYSLTSNPWLLSSLSQKGYLYRGLFNIIPDIFTTVAAVIMIYLTRT